MQARQPGPGFVHTMVVSGLLFGGSAMVRRMKAFVVANEKDRDSCFCALLGYAFVIGDPSVVNVEFIALNGFILALAIGADY